MNTETTQEKVVRGVVKTVYILCYIAFMWASIHHVATYFNNFEPDQDNTIGSYALAGAFDITALITTIGLMFFRKGMPWYIQVLIWIFILGLAGYSFLINWEYAAHFQSDALTLQPTGATTPIYENGVLHYVPVMRQNTTLLYMNPILASGFTIFALIYSIIGEFFGTKPPTIEELRERENYLKETSEINESIKQLQAKSKGKSFIQLAKEKAIESKEAWKEFTNSEESVEEIEAKAEESVEEIETKTEEPIEEIETKTEEPIEEIETKTEQETEEKNETKSESNREENQEENIPSWLATSGSTIHLDEVVKHTHISRKTLNNRVANRKIRATRSKEIVYKDSLLKWLKEEGIIQKNETTLTNSMPETLEKKERTTGELSPVAEQKIELQNENIAEHTNQKEERNTDEIPITTEEKEEEKEPVAMM